MVDYKFDALYRYIFIESLQKSGSRKVIRKFVLVGGAVCANSTGKKIAKNDRF